jgi:hypothetical protein
MQTTSHATRLLVRLFLDTEPHTRQIFDHSKAAVYGGPQRVERVNSPAIPIALVASRPQSGTRKREKATPESE